MPGGPATFRWDTTCSNGDECPWARRFILGQACPFFLLCCLPIPELSLFCLRSCCFGSHSSKIVIYNLDSTTETKFDWGKDVGWWMGLPFTFDFMGESRGACGNSFFPKLSPLNTWCFLCIQFDEHLGLALHKLFFRHQDILFPMALAQRELTSNTALQAGRSHLKLNPLMSHSLGLYKSLIKLMSSTITLTLELIGLNINLHLNHFI